jgi:hypothetical protein
MEPDVDNELIWMHGPNLDAATRCNGETKIERSKVRRDHDKDVRVPDNWLRVWGKCLDRYSYNYPAERDDAVNINLYRKLPEKGTEIKG